MHPAGRVPSRAGFNRGRSGYSAARRGGRRGWSKDHEISRTPSPPLGPILTKISRNGLNELDVNIGNAVITGVEDVASYNWTKGKEPTIMVPGMPPKWTPMHEPTKLKEDGGVYFRDPNAAHFASYPMEPVVRSIFETNPKFLTSEIDIFGCGSTLGNLLRFAREVDVDKPFRFLVEVIGETVFFIRRENSPTETIPDVYGFGHSFPEAYTTWGAEVKNSDSHQRIVRYQFGGHNILIRFEADGYLGDKVSIEREAVGDPRNVNDEDSLLSALAGTTISAQTPTDMKALRVIPGPGSIPQSAVFDLKTRSSRKKGTQTLSEQLPRLWIRQIPFFVLAYHDQGVFKTSEITIRDVTNDFAEWENQNESHLSRFLSLMKKITAFAKAFPGQKLEIRYPGGRDGELELRQQSDGVSSVLPEELALQWCNMGLNEESVHEDVLLKSGNSGEEGNSSDAEYHSSDEESEKDFTACSAEHCGYCGRCTY